MNSTTVLMTIVFLSALLVDQSLTNPINRKSYIYGAIPVSLHLNQAKPLLVERTVGAAFSSPLNKVEQVRMTKRDTDNKNGDESNNEILDSEPSEYYYRPLYRVSRLTESHRYYDDDEDWENAGYLRPGSDVGYMDSYDKFPTVA